MTGAVDCAWQPIRWPPLARSRAHRVPFRRSANEPKRSRAHGVQHRNHPLVAGQPAAGYFQLLVNHRPAAASRCRQSLVAQAEVAQQFQFLLERLHQVFGRTEKAVALHIFTIPMAGEPLERGGKQRAELARAAQAVTRGLWGTDSRGKANEVVTASSGA